MLNVSVSFLKYFACTFFSLYENQSHLKVSTNTLGQFKTFLYQNLYIQYINYGWLLRKTFQRTITLQDEHLKTKLNVIFPLTLFWKIDISRNIQWQTVMLFCSIATCLCLSPQLHYIASLNLEYSFYLVKQAPNFLSVNVFSQYQR